VLLTSGKRLPSHQCVKKNVFLNVNYFLGRPALGERSWEGHGECFKIKRNSTTLSNFVLNIFGQRLFKFSVCLKRWQWKKPKTI
jgi:hypothetical protein